VRRSHLTARLKGDELTPKQEFNNGEVSEWLKEHAWKVCIRQRIEGSNPSLTAIFKTKKPYEIHRVFSFLVFARRPLSDDVSHHAELLDQGREANGINF
jgi:hypothetical protein